MKRPQKLAVMLVPTPPYEICGLAHTFDLQNGRSIKMGESKSPRTRSTGSRYSSQSWTIFGTSTSSAFGSSLLSPPPRLLSGKFSRFSPVGSATDP